MTSLLPFKCEVCNGAGFTGVFLFSRTKCLVCNGQGATRHRTKPCPLCKGSGRERGYGMSWQCHGCRGQKYLSHKWYVCEVCRGEGKKSGVFSSSACVSCQGRGIVSSRQHACLHCKGKGRKSNGLFSSSECPACSGTGTVQGKQYRCHSCDASGKRLGKTCPMCSGRCWLPFDQLQCQHCHGSGVVKGWFSGTDCVSCKGVGYVPMHELVIDSDSGSEWDSAEDANEDSDGDIAVNYETQHHRHGNSKNTMRKKKKRSGYLRVEESDAHQHTSTDGDDEQSVLDTTLEGNYNDGVIMMAEGDPSSSTQQPKQQQHFTMQRQRSSPRKWCLFLGLGVAAVVVVMTLSYSAH
eukprot:m.39796 g.39796  ORF g.39796 m.39796 type:complete len:351 (-) comp10310_c0_seq4:2209-3261(-)